MNKRGQFFIIAALVVVGILVGLGTTAVTTRYTQEDKTVFDLSKEIDFEGKRVVDYGTFTTKSDSDTQELVTDLLTQYANENPESDITVVYGKGDSVVVLESVTQTSGDVNLLDLNTFSGTTRIIKESPFYGGRVVAGDVQFPFTPGQNQNFYIILGSETETGERNVASTLPEQPTTTPEPPLTPPEPSPTDETAPGIVTNLKASPILTNSITWTWTNPTDSDFAGCIISIKKGTTIVVPETTLAKTENSYKATALSANTAYTIYVKTIDSSGNENENVQAKSATTLGLLQT